MAYAYGSIDLGKLYQKRSVTISSIIHAVILMINFEFLATKIEPREDAIQVKMIMDEPVKKVQVLKTPSPALESEVLKEKPKEKIVSGTQKVIPKAKSLGNPNAKKVQNVQKGDPMSKDFSAYKPGTDFQKLKATNIGTGSKGSVPTTDKAGGSGNTYKGLDFSTKSLTNNANLGERFKIKNVADDMGAGDGKTGGVSSGAGRGGFGDGTITGSGTGTVEKAKILTNVGSLTGSTVGTIDSSKGAEGLSQKGTIVLAGSPDETVILGSMDPDVIRRRLLENLPQFRFCYQSELDKSDSIYGVVVLNFSITSSGNVGKMNIGGGNSITPQVKKCVGGVLKSIQFPEPKGGGTVDVKQPMNFQAREH